MYDGYAFEVIAPVNGQLSERPRLSARAAEAVVGDCWHRFYVRMLEVVQSIDLIRQAIDRYRSTGGPIERGRCR